MAIDHVVVMKTLTNNKTLTAQQAFITEIKNNPGIKTVSISNNVPGGRFSNVIGAIRPMGAKAEDGVKCYFIDMDENYLDLYHIELIAGNNFTNNNYDKKEFVLINATAAKMFGYASPSEAVNQKIVMGEMDNLYVFKTK